jgi:hypothetical protein
LKKLEKAIKKQGTKSKKSRRDDRKIGLVSIGKIAINLGETIKKTKFSPPSLIKATPTLIASNQDDVCLMPFSNAGDVMMTSSSQNDGIHVNYSTPTYKDPPEGKTTQQ